MPDIQQLLLTQAQAAKALAISVRTLRRLQNRGEIKPLKLGSNTIRYAPGDLEAWVDRQRESARTAPLAGRGD